MKTVLLLLLVFLATSASAETFVPYTPDSLKKGDYLTIESVHYYPYLAPGIQEELPWRAENIRKVIFRATVTDINAQELTVDYTLESVYDCRNDTEKPGFYYFDSRYWQDFASGEKAAGKQIARVTYDRKSKNGLISDKSDAHYAYSKTYVPFGVRQDKEFIYPTRTLRDSLNLNDLLAPATKDLLTGWKKDGTLLSIPGTRIIGASFALPPNTEFTCHYFDIKASKDSTIHKKIFIPYPTEYEVRERTVLLLTPGDSIIQNGTEYQGRGSEQNNFRYHNFRSVVYRYDEFDYYYLPDTLEKAFQHREALFQNLKKDFEKMDPYWQRVFELSERYIKGTFILMRYIQAPNKESWNKSSLLDWQAPHFASVNPLIDFTYSLQKQGVDYYNYFLHIYVQYKVADFKSDNLSLNKWDEYTLSGFFPLIKQIFSCYPKYLETERYLQWTMNNRMLSEIEEDYNNFITAYPDTSLTSQLINKYNKLLPFEVGNDIRKSGLVITDSLPLVRGSDRKYILLYLSTGNSLRGDNLQDARNFEKLLQTEGLSSTVKLEPYANFSDHNAKLVKPFKAIPKKQLQDLNNDLGMDYMAILMREDGTILHRQSRLTDTKTILDTIRKDMNRPKESSDILYFIYGCIITFLLALGIFYLYRRQVKAKQKQEQTRRQISELELRAIRSQMNPHFIFNALSSIQNLINRSANQEAGEYLVNFSRLLRKVLSTSEKKLVPLSDEIEQIQLYLKLEQLRFPFSYSLTVDKGIEPEVIEIPGMLIQPFVENAVKHGIGPRGAGEINIRLSLQNQLLVIDITDDGPGIKAADRDNGFGLRATSSQFEILKTVYNTEIDIQIENRQDEDPATTGCHVRLSIPL